MLLLSSTVHSLRLSPTFTSPRDTSSNRLIPGATSSIFRPSAFARDDARCMTSPPINWKIDIVPERKAFVPSAFARPDTDPDPIVYNARGMVSPPINWGIGIVPERKAFVIERLGKYAKTLTTGIHPLIPFVDQIAYVLSLEEQAIPLHRLTALTGDYIRIFIDATLYVKIVDPKLAAYSVNQKIFVTEIAHRNICIEIGKINSDSNSETFEKDALIEKMAIAINEAAKEWGLQCRLAIKDMSICQELQAVVFESNKKALLKAEEEMQACIQKAEERKQAIMVAKAEDVKLAMLAKAEEILRKIYANGGFSDADEDDDALEASLKSNSDVLELKDFFETLQEAKEEAEAIVAKAEEIEQMQMYGNGGFSDSDDLLILLRLV